MLLKILSVLLVLFITIGCSKNGTNPQNIDENNSALNKLSYTSPQNRNINGSTETTTQGEDTKRFLDEVKNDFYGPSEDIYLQNNLRQISTYTSPILTNDDDRYHNITIVRDRLNGYILKNGEEFSYNNVCGPYGKEDGFYKAPIMTENGKEEEYGGGVCQLSSTLYNAIKDLNVKITERHHHSEPVNYVPKNQDATVSLFNNLDFKFVNQTGYDLKFEVLSTEDSLTVNVYQT